MSLTAREISALAMSVLLGATAVVSVYEIRGSKVRVVQFCDLPNARCLPRDTVPTAELLPLTLCCSYYDGNCDIVTMITECDPVHEYAVICEWGRTTADGIECYD